MNVLISGTVTDVATVIPVISDDFCPDEEDQVSFYISISYLIIGTIGVLGNSLVIAVLLKYTTIQQQVTRMLLLNQSVCDLAASTILAFTYIENVVRSGSLKFDFPGANLACRIWFSKAALWSILNSSTYNLVAMNVERYLKIVHPIGHKLYLTAVKARLIICLVWMVGPCLQLTVVFTTRVKDDACFIFSFWPNSWLQQTLGFITIVFEFFLPLLIMIYCYIRMALAIRLRAKQKPLTSVQAEQRHQSQAQQKNFTIQKNIFKMLAVVSVCFVICWCSNEVFYLLYNNGYPLSFKGGFYHFSVFMVFANCCCNPFIYTLSYGDFRKGMKKLLRGKTPTNSVSNWSKNITYTISDAFKDISSI